MGSRIPLLGRLNPSSGLRPSVQTQPGQSALDTHHPFVNSKMHAHSPLLNSKKLIPAQCKRCPNNSKRLQIRESFACRPKSSMLRINHANDLCQFVQLRVISKNVPPGEKVRSHPTTTNPLGLCFG